jgi:hypothetical protein
MTNNNLREEKNAEDVQITTLANLEKEIHRLKQRTKTLAAEWESNNSNLKENFGDVLFRSIFSKLKFSGQVGNILSQFLFSQPNIMENLLKFRGRIVEKIKQIFKKR